MKAISLGCGIVAACLLGGILYGAETVKAEPKVRGRNHLLPQDFETPRPDGRFENHMAFAWDYVRRMTPEYSFDKLREASEMPAWRAKVRTKLGELLQIPVPLPKVEFKLLNEEKRNGYRLHRYEFYPEERLAIPILVLVPENAIAGKKRVPAVVCMPGSGASLNSLAGEPDEFGNRYPARNRQAWHYAQIGMIGVAIENPATAESGIREVNHFATQAQFARMMTLAGRSNWGFMTKHVLQTIDFMKEHPNVDSERIAVSGMSLGCIPALYAAVMSDDVAAVVYNDFVSSWAANALSVTKNLGGSVDARRPYGFHRWFDDEPDLMAAVAPRPMIFSEGGAWKGVIEKVQRAYRLAGAEQNLRIAYYEKYADPATRKYEDVALHQAKGLTGNDYLLFSNVDAGQHSFHPDVNLPWIAEVFFGKADFTPRQWAMIRASVVWPAQQQMPLDYEVEPPEEKRAAGDTWAGGLGPVVYNTDGCDMLDYPVGDPITYEGFVAQRLARDIPGSGVSAVGYCPVSSGFGFFTALKMGDTLLNPLPPGSRWRGRDVYNATADFAKQGLDALEMGLRYSRSEGRVAVASLRMNDTHDQEHTPEKPYFLFSPFKIRHPECLMGTREKKPPLCAWSAVDYTRPEVRKAMAGYVQQLADNYDFDALDLDFFRHVQYFRSVAWGAESASDEERAMMTDLVRDIRKILDARGAQKGRRLLLSVRTPDSAAYCHAVGLDVERWMKEKLIDVWCGSGYFRLCPWKESAEFAHRYGVKYYASLDESRIERHCARLKLPRLDGRNSRENFAARVAAATEEGCDGIVFFNIDDYPESERKAIAALVPGKTDGLNKDYFLVNRGSGGYTMEGFLKNGTRFRKLPPVDPGRGDAPQLQANDPYVFEMTVSDDFSFRSAQAVVTAEVLIQPTLPKGQLPTLIVNKTALDAPTVPRKDVITFSIPVSALHRGANRFSLSAPEACQFRDFVLRVRH
ncbi:MAG TPA: alpha/beta hydrolase family protein [Candidatus Latescibacteria bacterium]|nr:alpha/beta hydrolase family protein [Kiritimatiellia bacterium]HOS66168.1 alpha/beta hydrolase family protein [Candidatus Latescibacterota bacterium]HRT28303.1 alpha/beta hydrolase family protein [Kiritimatiellia bacterium]